MSSFYFRIFSKANYVSKRDVRAIMLYEFECGSNAAKTIQEIDETLGENLVSHSTVKDSLKSSKKSVRISRTKGVGDLRL
uniref:HTH_48 domain-containing protein n=1 Tax=Strongyloides papillosus TaxID=174720 RepID=A0A0N5C9U6_STREA